MVRPSNRIEQRRHGGGARADAVELQRRLRRVMARENQAATPLAQSPPKLPSLIDRLWCMAYRCAADAGRLPFYVSEGAGALTGYSKDELIASKGGRFAIHSDDAAFAAAEIAKAVDRRKRFAVSYRLIQRNGDVIWVMDRGRAVYDAAGKPRYLEGFVTDLTDREKRFGDSASTVEERLQEILDSVPQIVWSSSPGGQERYYNKQWYEYTGTTPADNDDMTSLNVIHPDDRERVVTTRALSMTSGYYEVEYRLRHHSGEYFWFVSQGRPTRDADGEVVHWYGTCVDIHQRVLAREALHESEALNRSIIQATADSIGMLDLAGRMVFVNDAGARQNELGDTKHIYGQDWTEIFPGNSRKLATKALAAARAGGVGRFSALRPAADGSSKWWDIVVTPVFGEDGRPDRFVLVGRDISEQKAAEARIEWVATHDALTGLPNRLLFRAHLQAAIEDKSRGGGLCLLLVDVDDFKQINDTLGHDAGDRLLCAFAERLSSGRPGDLVARLGGDEFAVILDHVSSIEEATAITDAILARLKEPHEEAGVILDCRGSIGASLCPQLASTATELLKQADVALYSSKSLARGRMTLFKTEMRAEMRSRASMLTLARDVLHQGLILPFYQPKVDLKTGRVAGFEALLRWRDAKGDIQGPHTIEAAFHDLDLACEISNRMIGLVIADMKQWLGRGVEFGHVAINASAAEFRRGGFAANLLTRLAEAGVPASHLQVEVTETVFLGRGAEWVEEALRELSAAGVKIALDDFGTGFASLSHLKQFPVDLIKIDRSFVRDIEEDPDDAAIIRAVISLGQSLNIEICAEGVETEAQHRSLVEQKCAYGQGYRYGKAAPARRVPGLTRSSLTAAARLRLDRKPAGVKASSKASGRAGPSPSAHFPGHRAGESAPTAAPTV